MYAGDEYYGDDVTNPLYRPQARATLARCRFDGDPAWLWTAPNGVPFYLTQTRSRKWVWWRSTRDTVSSEPFDSRDALLAHLAQAFREE